MSALKSLPEVETAGWYVRTRITDEDRDGSIVSNSGASLADHYAYAHTHGNTIAALTCEAINVARETGIGPAEMRRQRDELLAALKGLRENAVFGGVTLRHLDRLIAKAEARSEGGAVMCAHTPGPWKVIETGGVVEVVSGDHGIRIATIDSDNCALESAMHDARLIAAAPDLLAALKRVDPQCITTPDCGACSGCDARSAIAKAEGKS